MALENLVDTIGKTKVPKFIANPKGSRQFQQFIKLGSKEQRNSAIEALAKYVPELATRNIYALLTLEKIVTYGLKTDEKFTTDKILKPVMTERKIVEQLFFNKLGCKFLNKLYLHPGIKSSLKKELLAIVLIPRSIEILGDSQEKLRAYYLETCKKCIDKELMGLELVQKLFKQAVTDFPVATDQPFCDELLSMAADGLPHLLSSRDGVAAAVVLLGIASAKQKKNFIKELKGKFFEMAKNSVTCVVVIRLFDCVDDTVLVGKTILSELVGTEYEKCLELITHPCGRIPFLVALGKRSAIYPPDAQLLSQATVMTSMKDEETRLEEIRSKLVPSLKKVVENNLTILTQNEAAKDVLISLIKASSTELVASIMSQMPHPKTSGPILKEFPEIAAPAYFSALVAKDVFEISSSSVLSLLLNVAPSHMTKHIQGFISRNEAAIRESGNQSAIDTLATIPKGPLPSQAESMIAFPLVLASLPIAVAAKKQKTVSSETALFDEEEEEGEDELWGIVGDDDEYM